MPPPVIAVARSGVRLIPETLAIVIVCALGGWVGQGEGRSSEALSFAGRRRGVLRSAGHGMGSGLFMVGRIVLARVAGGRQEASVLHLVDDLSRPSDGLGGRWVGGWVGGDE